MQTLIAINQLDKKCSIIKGDADNVINDLKNHHNFGLWLHPSIGYRVIKGLNIEPLREYLTDDDPIIQFTDTQKSQ